MLVFIKNTCNDTLYTACSKNLVDVVKWLLIDVVFDPIVDYKFGFDVACKNGHKELVKLFLADDRVDPNFDGHYDHISIACDSGYREILDLLLNDPRIDPNAAYKYYFETMEGKQQVDIVKSVKLFLSFPQIDPAVDNNFPIRHACMIGFTKVVKILLEEDWVNPSDMDNEAIKSAHRNNRIDVVKLLLKDKRLKRDKFVKSIEKIYKKKMIK